MKSRRQFVMEGTIAAAALLAGKHLKAFDSISARFPGISSAGNVGYNNHLIFLHTTDTNTGAVNYIKNIQAEAPNTIVLKTDAEKLSDTISTAVNENYTIITKEGIKTGVIQVNPNDVDVIKNVDLLAGYLKTEKKCQLVVCVSQLGYKQKNAIDDLSLAYESKNIDVIINGHSTNFSPKTLTVPNKDKKEVIIQSSKGNATACGKLEIGFDENGVKKHIHLATKLYKNRSAA